MKTFSKFVVIDNLLCYHSIVMKNATACSLERGSIERVPTYHGT